MPPKPNDLSLPQHDEHPKHRERGLHEAQDAYPYTYDMPNIRGLAMCGDKPKAEAPDKAWIKDVIAAVVEIGVNSVKADRAEGETDRKAIESVAQNVRTGGPKAAFEAVSALATRGVNEGPVGELADFTDLYQEWPPPTQASDYFLDSRFAAERLAGVNPAWIERVPMDTGLPDDLNFSAEHYAAALGEGDSLEAAQAEGRLFTCSYRQLMGASAGSHPVPPAVSLDYEQDPAAWDAAYAARERAYEQGALRKMAIAPTALFALPRGGAALRPVGIQLAPNGWRGDRHRVFTPRDGVAWLAAKTCVSAADGTVHEAISHLGLTHLVQEAFALALHNCFAPRHPLHRLLSPHFEGTFLINNAADSSLVNSEGMVDKLLLTTIGSVIQIGAEAVLGYDFNASMFPEQLVARGVHELDISYPYRDDGLLVWGALEQWVRHYVEHYYVSDAEVGADLELQAFVEQVGQHDARDARGRQVGGRIKGVGEGGPRVQTRAYLVQMLTQIIWNGSAQHAAVNFPQGEPMTHAASLPLATLGPAPAGPLSDADFMSLLPHREIAQLQLSITKLLGMIHHTQLGHYPARKRVFDWFPERAVAAHAEGFRAALGEVEATINTRNQTREPYTYLLPSLIPQSINI